MKTIIAGSREITDREVIHEAIGLFEQAGFIITELVSGTARGVDKTAEEIFEGKLPIKRFPPNWDKYEKAAGPIRNKQMAEYADALIAIWDGSSKGTKDMVMQANEQENIKVILILNIATNKYRIMRKT